jgi:hypothetical protein
MIQLCLFAKGDLSAGTTGIMEPNPYQAPQSGCRENARENSLTTSDYFVIAVVALLFSVLAAVQWMAGSHLGILEG